MKKKVVILTCLYLLGALPMANEKIFSKAGYKKLSTEEEEKVVTIHDILGTEKVKELAGKQINIDLSNRGITSLKGLEELLEKYKNRIRWLDLSHNNIRKIGEEASSIGENWLDGLNLSHNEIEECSQFAFGKEESNERMQNLNLSHNKIRYLFLVNPPEVTLDLSYNEIGSGEKSFRYPPVPRYLTHYLYIVTGYLYKPGGGGIGWPEKINLSHNKLSGTFELNSHGPINAVNLSFNPALTNVKVRVAYGDRGLTLDLSHCNFSKLPEVLPSNLHFLDLSFNKLSKLTAKELKWLKAKNAVVALAPKTHEERYGSPEIWLFSNPTTPQTVELLRQANLIEDKSKRTQGTIKLRII